MWNIDLLGKTHKELIKVVEILGRSSNNTTTIRDSSGRVHITPGRHEVGDKFTLIIGHHVLSHTPTHMC